MEATVDSLYNALGTDKFPEGWQDYHVAKAIRTAIANDTYVTVTDGHIKFKTSTDGTSLAGYPGNINLPDGAALLGFDSDTNKFSYKNQNLSENIGNTGNYAYPANLYYWGKSDILTSNSMKESKYTATMTWDNTEETGIFNEYTDGNEITTTTRSVLLKEPVQYGVARLNVKVLAAHSGTGEATLADNGDYWKEMMNTRTSYIPVSNIALTGVIIGGQKAVNWKFETSSGGTEYSIYDDIVKANDEANGIAIGTSEVTAATNSTLVLETAGGKDDSKTTDNKYTESVNVALEFVNNGTTGFWGQDGNIPAGCKFYLVGQLNAGEVDKTEADKTLGKVFKQDYTTTATFTIKNLKHAVYHIPDLRNPAVELGLSVNLEWQDGIHFTHTFE